MLDSIFCLIVNICVFITGEAHGLSRVSAAQAERGLHYHWSRTDCQQQKFANLQVSREDSTIVRVMTSLSRGYEVTKALMFLEGHVFQEWKLRLQLTVNFCQFFTLT